MSFFSSAIKEARGTQLQPTANRPGEFPNIPDAYRIPLSQLPYNVINGWLDVRDYGAKGDKVNDDAPAINAAIQDASIKQAGVRLPGLVGQASGGTSYYLCKSSIQMIRFVPVFGDGRFRTQIRFLNNSHGFEQGNKAQFSTLMELGGMWIQGMADSSNSPAWTAGIYAGNSQYVVLRDVVINRFVDGCVSDGTLAGASLWLFQDVWVFTDGYPNMINGYPRYLIHVMSDSLGVSGTKAQGQTYRRPVLFSNPTETQISGVADGTNGQTIGPLGCGVGLWAESGIKVYAVNAQGISVKLTSGVDYQVLAGSAAGPVIATGSINVGGTKNIAPVQQIYIKMLGTQPNSTAITIYYSDPWARKGLYVEASNASRATDVMLSGCETGVQFSDTGVFRTAYGPDANGNANNSLRFATSYNSGTVSIAFVNPGANNPATTAAAAGTPNYTVTITLATDAGGNVLSTAQNVIDAIRADPTSYSLLDVRSTTFVAGAGPYPAAIANTRSDNTGIVAAFAAQQLTATNAQTANPYDIDITYAQITNLVKKWGAGAGRSPLPGVNVTDTQLVSRDPISRLQGFQEPAISRLPSDLIAPFDPRVARDSQTFIANLLFGTRVIVPKDGIIRELYLYVVTASGNAIGVVYDTGDSNQGSRTALWAGASTSLGGVNATYIKLGDLQLPVVRGQQLDFGCVVDNAIAQTLRVFGAGNANNLPTSFWAAPGGASAKLAWQFAVGSFSIPAEVAEANCTPNASPILLIARLA